MISHGHGMHPILLIKFFHFALKSYFNSKTMRCFWCTKYSQFTYLYMHLLVIFFIINHKRMVINHLKYIFKHFRVFMPPFSETNVMTDVVAVCTWRLCSGHARLKIKYSLHFHCHEANPWENNSMSFPPHYIYSLMNKPQQSCLFHNNIFTEQPSGNPECQASLLYPHPHCPCSTLHVQGTVLPWPVLAAPVSTRSTDF